MGSEPGCRAFHVAGCNAVSIRYNVCWPKKIEDGQQIPPNSDPTVDHISLCPLHRGCGDWLAGHDRKNVGDISSSHRKVADHEDCVKLCKSTVKCNAIAYVPSNRMCYPKHIPAGRAHTPMPNQNSRVDYLQLCPMELACGSWLEGHDRQSQGDISGSRQVPALPCPNA